MAKSISLGKDSITKLFLNFSIPAVYWNDSYCSICYCRWCVCGRGVGAEGLAALNLGYPIINFGAALSLMFGIGGATLISLNPEIKDIVTGAFWYILSY